MKKVILLLAVVGTIGVSSCKDDDNIAASSTCKTCIFQSSAVQYCDKGNGTVDVTSSGQTFNTTLGGVSFDEFITDIKDGGYTCD